MLLCMRVTKIFPYGNTHQKFIRRLENEQNCNTINNGVVIHTQTS